MSGEDIPVMPYAQAKALGQQHERIWPRHVVRIAAYREEFVLACGDLDCHWCIRIENGPLD
jgi:hypothetical protein